MFRLLPLSLTLLILADFVPFYRKYSQLCFNNFHIVQRPLRCGLSSDLCVRVGWSTLIHNCISKLVISIGAKPHSLLFGNVWKFAQRSHLVSARSDGRSGGRMSCSLVVRNRHLMLRLHDFSLWRFQFRLKWWKSLAHQAQPSGVALLFASAWSLLRLFRPQ